MLSLMAKTHVAITYQVMGAALVISSDISFVNAASTPRVFKQEKRFWVAVKELELSYCNEKTLS